MVVLVLCIALILSTVSAEEMNVRAGDRNISYAYAKTLLENPDIGNPDRLNDAVEIFGRLGGYGFSDLYKSYAETIFYLAKDDITGAKRSLTTLEKMSKSSGSSESADNFLKELAVTEGMCTIEQLRDYCNARVAQNNGDIVVARNLYSKCLILDAADRATQLMNINELPEEFDEAWELEQSGEIRNALDIYKKLVDDGYKLAEDDYNVLKAQYEKWQAAQMAEADGDLYTAIAIYDELIKAHYYQANDWFENTCKELYQLAQTCEEQGGYGSARDHYKFLAGYDYSDSVEQANRLNPLVEAYDAAKAMEDSQNFSGALEAYAALGEFPLAQKDYERLNRWIEIYNAGNDYLQNGDYSGAMAQYSILAAESVSWVNTAYWQTLNTVYDLGCNAEATGDLYGALTYYSIDNQYGHEDGAAAYDRLSRTIRWTEAANYESAQEFDQALVKYQELISMGEPNAQEAYDGLSYRMQRSADAENLRANGDIAGALAAYYELVGYGHPGASDRFNSYANDVYIAAQSAASEANYGYASQVFGLLAAYGYGDSAAQQLIQNANSITITGDFYGTLAEFSRLVEQQVPGAAEAKAYWEQTWLQSAQDYYASGSLSDALYLCCCVSSYGNADASNLLWNMIYQKRLEMRRFMLSGDLQSAQAIHDVLVNYRTDIDPVTYVDTTLPEEKAYSENYKTLVLNTDFYRETYTDVTGNYKQHWLNTGIYEGRMPDAAIDPHYYAAQFDQWALGNDPNKLYEDALYHYWFTGILEDRNASAGFNALDYMILNPDIAEVNDNNIYKCMRYFINEGYKEGRATMIYWQ